MDEMQNSIDTLKELQKPIKTMAEVKHKPNKFVDTPEARAKLMKMSSELLDAVYNGYTTKTGVLHYVNPKDSERKADIHVRFLTGKEEVAIELAIEKAMKEKESSSMKLQMFETFCETLSRATQPSELCASSDLKGISRETFEAIRLNDLHYIFKLYEDWVEKESISPYDIEQERLNVMTDELKKKPILFSELGRRYSVPMGIYFITLCDKLEAQIKYLEEENARLLQMES